MLEFIQYALQTIGLAVVVLIAVITWAILALCFSKKLQELLADFLYNRFKHLGPQFPEREKPLVQEPVVSQPKTAFEAYQRGTTREDKPS